jgi:hypothetical protein
VGDGGNFKRQGLLEDLLILGIFLKEVCGTLPFFFLSFAPSHEVNRFTLLCAPVVVYCAATDSKQQVNWQWEKPLIKINFFSFYHLKYL